MTVPDLKHGWTDCAQIWYTVKDRLVGGRAHVNWRYPGAISHVQGSLSRSLRWSPQKALYWCSTLRFTDLARDADDAFVMRKISLCFLYNVLDFDSASSDVDNIIVST